MYIYIPENFDRHAAITDTNEEASAADNETTGQRTVYREVQRHRGGTTERQFLSRRDYFKIWRKRSEEGFAKFETKSTK